MRLDCQLHAMSLDQCMRCFHLHLHAQTVQAALLCLVAVYVAGAALHDQPFRALHGVATASTLDATLLIWAYYSPIALCKRKPL